MYRSVTYIERHFNVSKNKMFNISYNNEYESLEFELKTFTYQSRLAKKTPKKKGYFLACWFKDNEGINIPYSKQKFADYLIVVIIDGNNQGYFNFPKNILVDRGILTSSGNKGKMAFRVYPDWESELNATALKTQHWQNHYFVNTSF